jgi:cell division protein FtsZ
MTVQAGVARLLVAHDPQQAQEAIGAVEQAGRRALDELRHLLGVLRPETSSGELDPQPAPAQKFGFNSLIHRMTGAATSGHAEAGGQAAAAARPSASYQPAEEDLRIEIPAFLRRQAN